jgi:hypothetical protein
MDGALNTEYTTRALALGLHVLPDHIATLYDYPVCLSIYTQHFALLALVSA